MASSRSFISARALNSSWEVISVLRFLNFSSDVSPFCLKRGQLLLTSFRVNLRNLISRFKASCTFHHHCLCISSRASMSISGPVCDFWQSAIHLMILLAVHKVRASGLSSLFEARSVCCLSNLVCFMLIDSAAFLSVFLCQICPVTSHLYCI